MHFLSTIVLIFLCLVVLFTVQVVFAWHITHLWKYSKEYYLRCFDNKRNTYIYMHVYMCSCILVRRWVNDFSRVNNLNIFGGEYVYTLMYPHRNF